MRVTEPPEARGFPTIIARFRRPSGELSGGISSNVLADDCSRHLGDPKAKMMMGPDWCAGCVIMLSPIDRRRQTLGIGEGVETTLAGMRYFGVPGWVTGSAKGLRDFGDFLKSSGGMIAAGPDHPVVKLQRLLIWPIAVRTAKRTLGHCIERRERWGKRFGCTSQPEPMISVDDLANGRPAPQPQPEPEESRKRSDCRRATGYYLRSGWAAVGFPRISA